MEEKACSRCGETKPRILFDKNCTSSDGLHSNCKECRRAYIDRNRDEIYRKNRAYYRKNRRAIVLKKRKKHAAAKRAAKREGGVNEQMLLAWELFQD